MAIKRSIRYKVQIGDTVKYRDTMPTDDECERLAHLAQERGYDFMLSRCETIVDMDAPIGDRIRLNDTILHEYRH